HAGRSRRTPAPGRARLAHLGPDARAEQPGRRDGTGRRRATRTDRRYAAQARHARRRPDPGRAAAQADSGRRADHRTGRQGDRASHQWIDVHDGIKSTLVMLSHKLGDGIRVVKDFDRTLPQIPAHPGELNQVWTNLIDNAVQAMAGAGTLTIRTTRDGDRVLVEIGDTGPGIPPELHKRVFEPFFTTKPVGEGT